VAKRSPYQPLVLKVLYTYADERFAPKISESGRIASTEILLLSVVASREM